MSLLDKVNDVLADTAKPTKKTSTTRHLLGRSFLQTSNEHMKQARYNERDYKRNLKQGHLQSAAIDHAAYWTHVRHAYKNLKRARKNLDRKIPMFKYTKLHADAKVTSQKNANHWAKLGRDQAHHQGWDIHYNQFLKHSNMKTNKKLHARVAAAHDKLADKHAAASV